MPCSQQHAIMCAHDCVPIKCCQRAHPKCRQALMYTCTYACNHWQGRLRALAGHCLTVPAHAVKLASMAKLLAAGQALKYINELLQARRSYTTVQHRHNIHTDQQGHALPSTQDSTCFCLAATAVAVLQAKEMQSRACAEAKCMQTLLKSGRSLSEQLAPSRCTLLQRVCFCAGSLAAEAHAPFVDATICAKVHTRVHILSFKGLWLTVLSMGLQTSWARLHVQPIE